MISRKHISAFLFLASFSFVYPAFADSPKLIGQFGAWKSYSVQSDSGKVCYIVGQPSKSEGSYDPKNRDGVFALVTHRPAEKSRNVFSYVAGYSYQAGQTVQLSVDGKAYSLFTQDDTAWAEDEAADVSIVTALRKGSKMTVKGTSSRGTATTDTFSLKGSGGALDSIAKACPK